MSREGLSGSWTFGFLARPTLILLHLTMVKKGRGGGGGGGWPRGKTEELAGVRQRTVTVQC
jgi:hypothetical protein